MKTKTKPTGKDLPLQCKIEGEELVVRIGIDVIAYAAENIPELFAQEDQLRVCDKMEFAKDVCIELLSEEEDGSGPLSNVLDKAAISAWENGSLGCYEESNPKVFTNCNVCGIVLRTAAEDEMGMCERCADE